MLWYVTIALTGPRPKVDQEGGNLDWERKATGRERVFLTLLDWILIEQGQPVDRFPNRSAGWPEP